MGFENKTGLQLRSLIKKSGELELSLAQSRSPSPPTTRWWCASRRRRSIPSDLGLLLGAGRHDDRQGRPAPATSRWSPRQVPEAADEGHGRRGSTSPCRSATRAPAWWSRPAPRDAAQALLGKTVGDDRRRHVRAIPRREGRRLPGRCPTAPPPAEGASCFVNPLTALGMVETMRRGGPQGAGAHRRRLQPRPDAEQDLPQGRRRPGQHRAQRRAGGDPARASARNMSSIPARRASWTT